MRMDNLVALDRCHGAERPVGFVVEARSEPGILIRILAPFARRGMQIDRLACETERGTLTVEAFMRDMPEEAVRQVQGNIGQVVGVVRLDVQTGFGAAMLASNAQATPRLCA